MPEFLIVSKEDTLYMEKHSQINWDGAKVEPRTDEPAEHPEKIECPNCTLSYHPWMERCPVCHTKTKI